MNLWGKKNNSNWHSDMRSKKENHINISNDLKDLTLLYEIFKDIADIKAMLKVKKWKETENARKIKELNNKVEELIIKMHDLTDKINKKYGII